MESHGATKSIDYTSQGIRQKVKELTNGKGVNVAVDQVGGDTLLECVKRSVILLFNSIQSLFIQCLYTENVHVV